MERLLKDVRYGLRRLAREPGFSVPAILTLGLGIGATAAIFALVNSVLLQPLPYAASDRLVTLQHAAPGFGISEGGQSDATFAHYRKHNRVFEEIGAYHENVVSLTDRDDPERIQIAMATPGLFSVLGVRPTLGRVFTPEEIAADALPVLMSHELWARRYGADPDIIGQRIETNRTPKLVVGVMPPGFDFPRPETQLWYAMEVDASGAGVRDLYLSAIGRLRPEISPAEAEADLQRLIASLPDGVPDVTPQLLREAQFRAVVTPLKDAAVGDVRRALLILLCTAVFVLLIACANVINLVLIRTERQRREVAVARALGASGGALARRFLSESLLLAALGGALGLAVAYAAVAARFGFDAGQLPRLHELRVDAAAVAATALLTFASGLVLGVVALLSAGRRELTGALKGGPRNITRGREGVGAQRLLVALQVALALTLLIASAAMVQSFWRLQRVELGFDPASVVTFELNPPARQYREYPRAAHFHQQVLEELRALPGVTAAEAILGLPLEPAPSHFSQPLIAEGRAAGRHEIPPMAAINLATPGYFEAMRIPLVRGRSFQAGDLLGEAPPVVVSAALARTLFREEDAIGRRVRLAEHPNHPAYTIVGVVGDVHGEAITAGRANSLYFPVLDDLHDDAEARVPIPYVPREMTIIVRTSVPPLSLLSAARRIVHGVDAQIPVARVRTLEQIVAASTARTRLTTLLLLIAAASALFLGAVGIYGVVSYAVSGRTREIGVRMALGARTADVSRMVLRQGTAAVLAGLLAGVIAALALMRFLGSLLFEVSPTDPLTFAAMSLLLLLVALLASYLPARRAARVDPSIALRSE